MTKREAKAHKLAWNTAIAEGRAVHFNTGSFRSFKTADEAQRAVDDANRMGIEANIIDPKLAQL